MIGWTRRFTRIGIGVALLLLLGTSIQGVMTALERQRFARPGQMADTGGHQIHLRCSGQGQPSVVLDAAALSTSAEWAWVQRDVSRLTRVCSFDRSGLGYSEAGDAPYDPARAPGELHAALEQAGVRAPYLLGGHGLGAAFAEMYAGQYASDLVGLVLIDPPAPRVLADAETRARWTNASRRLSAMPWFARIGWLRLHNPLAGLAAGLPERQYGEARMYLVTPDHLARGAQELAALDRTLALAAQAAPPERLPVTVIRAAEPDARAEEAIALTSSFGSATPGSATATRHQVAGATDATILANPTHAAEVSRIIGALVNSARAASVPVQ